VQSLSSTLRIFEYALDSRRVTRLLASATSHLEIAQIRTMRQPVTRYWLKGDKATSRIAPHTVLVRSRPRARKLLHLRVTFKLTPRELLGIAI
jgi:hypothetical protein